jgi:hypothetical protein
VKDALPSRRQVVEIEERCRRPAQQRRLGYDANLGTGEEKRRHVEHVGGQVDGVVVDAQRRQIGEVGGRRGVVDGGIEGVVVPGIGRVRCCRHRHQKEGSEGRAASGGEADEESPRVEDRARVGEEVAGLHHRREEVG